MNVHMGNAANARITTITVQNDDKYALQLLMLQATHITVDHYKNATSLIPVIINTLTANGITHEVDFTLFACNYIHGLKTFIMTMPKSYANIIQREVHVIAHLENTAYKLEPKPDPYVAKAKKIDTGVNWATCITQAGTTDKLDAIQMSIKSAFGNHHMRLVEEVQPIFDKEIGANNNKYRAAFEILDGWDKLTVHKIRDSKLPSGAGVTIKFSNEFHDLHGLHVRCSKTTDNRSFISLRCSCGTSGAGPSGSMANRQAARDAHRERALKRARTESAKGNPFD